MAGALPLVVMFAAAQAAHEGHEKLGSVRFETSCDEAARPEFTRAVALLHSFEFKRAVEGFEAALAKDPECAMAHWGIALSDWSNPFAAGIKPAAALQRGRARVEKARAARHRTPREEAWVAAAAQLYADFETRDQRTRMLAYERAMADVAAKFPKDDEAQIFHALALAAVQLPTDKSYAQTLEAAAVLEKILPRQPDHPGLAHYVIHSYDYPPLAARAVAAARKYAAIAPSSPHALHMPSHTFTRLGYWQDSIETNIRSAEAARRDGVTAEELHTMDYRTYAYLQTAQDASARRMLEALPEVEARFDPDAVGSAAPGVAGVFALAAIPARWALERGAWAEAARLQPRPSRYPFTDAMTHFARALGGARSGALDTARAAAGELEKIEERLSKAGEGYWAEQVGIEKTAARSWLAFAEGRQQEALAEMRAAAEREDATDKNAITPGPLAPARELLGEMLLEADQPAAARVEFEKTLAKEPGRFRATYGAARAARLAGDLKAARKHSAALVKICAKAEAPLRAELAEARAAAK